MKSPGNYPSSETNHLKTTIDGGDIFSNNNKENIPVTYTSLLDVLPLMNHRKSIEEEVKLIKNPLVRQAALAYVSLMSDDAVITEF